MAWVRKMNRRGSLLVEHCLGLMLTVSLLSLGVWQGGKFCLQLIATADAYLSARAHLYHQDLEKCQPLAFWPRRAEWRFVKKCPMPGEASVVVHWGSQPLASAHIILRARP